MNFLLVVAHLTLVTAFAPPPRESRQGLFNLGRPDDSVHGCCLSADGKRLVVGGCGFHMGGRLGDWVAWEIPTGRVKAVGKMDNTAAHGLALSPDGRLLAAIGDGAELRLFDAATGKVLHEYQGHRACGYQVTFTPDGKRLLSAAHDSMLRVWDVTTHRPLATFRFTSEDKYLNGWALYPERAHEVAPVTVTYPEQISRLRGFAISPDGRTLAVAVGTVDLWLLDLATGKERCRFKTGLKVNGIYSVTYSRDGRWLAVGGGSARKPVKLEVWDVAAGKRQLVLAGHAETALCLAFSPDADRLLSSGFDGVKLWDLATGRCQRHLRFRGRDRVEFVAFLPDGKTFVTASGSGPTQFWDAATGKQVSPIKK